VTEPGAHWFSYDLYQWMFRRQFRGVIVSSASRWGWRGGPRQFERASGDGGRRPGSSSTISGQQASRAPLAALATTFSF